ncbi:kinesin light chain, partial [Rhizoctonia solani AG-3 Rhs1AP]
MASIKLGKDGGGVRGLSSLIILQEIMHRVENTNTGGKVHPYEYFDIIAGTGTGGISACMLGRLRMPIDKAILEYAKLVKDVFRETKIIGPTMYKGTKLQDALKAMVREATGNEEETVNEDTEHISCKTAIFAMSRHNLNAGLPVLFRSYAVATNPGPRSTIWQALYATMAHPDLFKGIEIVDSSVSQSFVGGELGCSNPIAHVLSEVKRVYPDRQVACIISIGAGHTRTIQVPTPRRWHRTQDAIVMKDMAIDSERVAEEMVTRFEGTSGVYFRFNVDQGLQNMKDGSWERLGEAMQHTKAYLQKGETSQKLDGSLVMIFVSFGLYSPRTYVWYRWESIERCGSHKAIIGIKRCPVPTKFYTGYEDENAQVIACITGGKSKLRVCVIYGLGGVGKTQLALSVIERTWTEWDHIIYVDASSAEAIEKALEEFGTAKSIGQGYKDVIDWMEFCGERWLMVFDNADTPSTNVQQYIPTRGQGCSVLVTTRLTDLANLTDGPESVCHLSRMSQTDGAALLVKIASLGNQCMSDYEKKAAEKLVQDFGCLALAIVHAGAYISHSRGMTITEYRSLFLSQRRRMLDEYNELPATAKLDKRGDTVYTTWRICYDQLKPESCELLWLIAYLHHDSISVDIFKRAAQGMHSHIYPLSLTDLESQAQSHVQRYLATLLDSNGLWDTVRFTRVMADLTSYSLIDFDRVNLTYRMHVLVHDWAKMVAPKTDEFAVKCTATLLSLSIDRQEDVESLAYKRQLGLHVTSVLSHRPDIGVNYSYYFREVYRHTGQWNQVVRLVQHVVGACQEQLKDDDLETWEAMGYLGYAYTQLGQWDEALHLQAQVLNARKRLCGEEHPSTLISMSNLAMTNSRLGRYDEAEQLQVQVLDARKRVLGEEHPHTLTSINNLASTYSRLGRYNEAEQLQIQVVNAQKRILGEEHPDTLSFMSNLAATYSDLGRYDEAEQLAHSGTACSQASPGRRTPRYGDFHGSLGFDLLALGSMG